MVQYIIVPREAKVTSKSSSRVKPPVQAGTRQHHPRERESIIASFHGIIASFTLHSVFVGVARGMC